MTELGKFIFWCAFIVCGIFWAYFTSSYDFKNGKWIIGTLWAIVGFFTSFCINILLLVLLNILSMGEFEPDKTTSKEMPIYSMGLNNKMEINGSFVLGCGTVNGESYTTYRYFTCENERYHLNEVNANNFDIVCTDSVAPKVVIDATMEVSKIKYLKWFWDVNKISNMEQEIDPQDYKGTIYIPKNSIIQSYKIQL
jgi:hypothetical protein